MVACQGELLHTKIHIGTGTLLYVTLLVLLNQQETPATAEMVACQGKLLHTKIHIGTGTLLYVTLLVLLNLFVTLFDSTE